MIEFQPPPFEPHRWLRGGHLQTVVGVRTGTSIVLSPQQHVVEVSDGDAIVLHEDCPASWQPGDGSMLLVHGLAGCHEAPYMQRLASTFLELGLRVFRMDMRGVGAAGPLARNVTHAGRSDDVVAALGHVASCDREGPYFVTAISMGGNQTLRALGRIGAGLDPQPDWFSKLSRIAVVAPPIDLIRCSRNMNRWRLRFYNHYFIRSLLSRIPEKVAEREDFQRQRRLGRPRTMWELDDRITAPLSGFSGAQEYYEQSSAAEVTSHLSTPTLVLAAEDDPLVPIGCFVDNDSQWSSSARLVVAPTGGHVGFIDRDGQSWMDRVMTAWFDHERKRNS